MAAIWLSAAVALRQDAGIAAMEDRIAIYEIRVCLAPGLLAHIHLGKRGAQCIAGDRSGQWVAIARCAEESTVHVFLTAPGFEAALPAHASADPIFLSFPLPIPIARSSLGPPRCWRGHNATRHHVTVSQTLSSHHRPQTASAVPRLAAQVHVLVHVQVHALQQQTPTTPAVQSPGLRYALQSWIELCSFPSTPPSTLAAWAGGVPGVSARGAQCQCRQGVGGRRARDGVCRQGLKNLNHTHIPMVDQPRSLSRLSSLVCCSFLTTRDACSSSSLPQTSACVSAAVELLLQATWWP
jgi:hypothetical protein